MKVNRLKKLIAARKQGKEDANTLVIIIMLFPVMFSVFGVAVDLSIGTYTNSNLQSALDTSTQSSLSRAINPGTNGNTAFTPRLTSKAAQEYITNFYDANRTDSKNGNENPFLKCQTKAKSGSVLIKPPSGCGWSQNSYSLKVTGNVLEAKVEVYEVSTPVFLNMIGINKIEYTITSSARTTYATN